MSAFFETISFEMAELMLLKHFLLVSSLSGDVIWQENPDPGPFFSGYQENTCFFQAIFDQFG